MEGARTSCCLLWPEPEYWSYSCSSLLCSLMRACAAGVLRSLRCSAYLSVLMVWSPDVLPGHTHANITIFTLSQDWKESRNTLVRLHYLKGTWTPPEDYPLAESRALMHSLSPKRDLLISAPSAWRSFEFSLQSAARSLPAKSTSSNFPHFLTPSS